MKQQLLTLLTFAVIIVSCSKKDSTPKYSISDPKVELNYDKEHQFTIKQGANVIDASSYRWSSTDETVGTISSTGLFKAKKVGKTVIKAEGMGSILTSDVVINPYSTLCLEPYTEFGASLATVKGKEARVLQTQTASALIYKGENPKVTSVYYGFTNNTLDGAIVIFANTHAVIEEAIKFFAERYIYQGESEEVFYFANNNIIVAMSIDDSLGFHAIYIKNTIGKVSSLSASKIAIQSARIKMEVQPK